MYEFSPNTYTRLADELFEDISSLSFYSGAIEFSQDDTTIRFVATLIPYFSEESERESTQYTLTDLIPVWWEVHTTNLDGEILNDFDFNLFKFYICQK